VIADALGRRGAVIVTGGAGAGIGSAISRAVARAGWPLLIADHDAEAARRAAAELAAEGHRVAAVEVDVSDTESVARMFRHLLVHDHGLHGLVNSAGVGLITPLADVTDTEWDRVMGVDLRGAFLCSREAIRRMTRTGGGSIVNIGSVQALGPHVGYSTYAAAKAGVVGLTRGIAADHGRDGIRCNIVHPGLVDSPQNRHLFARWGDPEAWIRSYVETRQMLPRLIGSDEIGEVVSFLLSDAARSITAAELTVDAGSSRMAFDNTDG
jgi:3-oxoacyl-[acyl-carrier protein] reductase